MLVLTDEAERHKEGEYHDVDVALPNYVESIELGGDAPMRY